jgi:tRNA-uridine 2-sulfurtransferase
MKTAYVGMSGGVDSSVAAALLQQQGYRVVGVYMKNWTEDVAGTECPWRKDLLDAQAAAATLDIPFKVFDFEQQYRDKVVGYMVEEYRSGRTPNPDVMCNQEIKFKLFLDVAMAEGADLVATGHYARVKPDGDRAALYAGLDNNKDQSYFLYRITSSALKYTLMPVGGLTKPKVRQLAEQFGLPNAKKPDSQGICFVGEVGIKDFLKCYIAPQEGPVVRVSDGKIVGRHDGAAYYTIGQRRGLAIGGGRPYYVVGKEMAENALLVTDDPNNLALSSAEFELVDSHWIQAAPVAGKTYQVKVRYRGELTACGIEQTGKGYRVQLLQPQRAIASGQAAVIYDGHKVMGGGSVSTIKTLSKDLISYHNF